MTVSSAANINNKILWYKNFVGLKKKKILVSIWNRVKLRMWSDVKHADQDQERANICLEYHESENPWLESGWMFDIMYAHRGHSQGEMLTLYYLGESDFTF